MIEEERYQIERQEHDEDSADTQEFILWVFYCIVVMHFYSFPIRGLAVTVANMKRDAIDWQLQSMNIFKSKQCLVLVAP